MYSSTLYMTKSVSPLEVRTMRVCQARAGGMGEQLLAEIRPRQEGGEKHRFPSSFHPLPSPRAFLWSWPEASWCGAQKHNWKRRGRGGSWEVHGPGSARPPLIPKLQPHSFSSGHTSRADHQGYLLSTVTQGPSSRGTPLPSFLLHSLPRGASDSGELGISS